MGRFESIRSQDTGRQALERGGQTPSTHLGRCRTVSLRPREVEPADPRDSRCGRASSRKIKKPVEGRFSPLPRSTIPLLVGPRSQRQWHRPLQRSRDASGRTPLRKPASGSAAAAWSRAPPGLQQRLTGGLQGKRGDRARRVRPRGPDRPITTTHGDQGDHGWCVAQVASAVTRAPA